MKAYQRERRDSMCVIIDSIGRFLDLSLSGVEIVCPFVLSESTDRAQISEVAEQELKQMIGRSICPRAADKWEGV